VEKLTERISVKVTPALKRDIDELARRERRSMNQLFTMGMELLLENHKKTAIDKRGKRV
jgi:predicted transcriptional regulator